MGYGGAAGSGWGIKLGAGTNAVPAAGSCDAVGLPHRVTRDVWPGPTGHAHLRRAHATRGG
eukprot:CAMPEP_0174293212 /NCGR_PEP_ID=MMETSP0809-20121228/37864_1 /TAXON_ID=73025 ORGANISM="Eutreptiella gymnastica-like, Strain CCMP1594" /NCGR_SAMPLE_ID=MMETSP0809 /ASSEMBLY_ACC=CAM_ASM_000658 /LENGTH=60 /DNA_ID=CAMNT_0015393835 /DNA_START=45 /DNA_END=224 /DNA_ORIENTATION=+